VVNIFYLLQRQKVKEKYWYALSKVTEKSVRFTREFEREVWVLPERIRHDSVSSGMENVPPRKDQHIASLSTAEIHERFSQTYVLCLGKVFTNIGYELLSS
jgi:hypothetical protein